MSDASNEREWRFYLDDMIGFAERVIEYTDGLDQAGFETSSMTYDATLRNLELIGEAATRIPQSVRDAAVQIPWRQMIATRNRLIHAYLGIDNDTLWSILRDDIRLRIVDPREYNRLRLGIVAKEQPEAPTDLRTTPMTMRRPQRVPLPILVACRVAGYALQDQLAQRAEQLDVGVALEAFRVTALRALDRSMQPAQRPSWTAVPSHDAASKSDVALDL